MLVIISGNVGTGKTLLMSIFAYFSKSKKIYANYELKVENVITFSLSDFLKDKYNNCLILLDEAYLYLESRSSMKAINKVLSYLLFQSRKSNCDIILTAQLLSTIDVRFRSLTDIFIVSQYLNNKGFKYNIIDNAKKKERVLYLPFNSAIGFFDLYDTTEKINNIEDLTEVHKITDSESEKLSEVAEIVVEMKEYFKNPEKITKEMITYYFELKRRPAYLKNIVYVECNKK